MADVGQKIDIPGFEIVSGVALGITLLLAAGRVYVKIAKFGRLYVDDGFFILATVLLIAGTTMVFLALPYNQTEVEVGAGAPPPPDIAHQLDYDVKFQDAATFLTNASIYSVKFSFLFFFRLLLQHTGKLQAWWWFVCIFTIPCAIICSLTNFMVCPAFGDQIMAVCVSNSALTRQIAVLYTVVSLDILTDLLLISIPVLLLWSVKISVRRKLGLGSLLCLSTFCIITNVIRAAGHKLTNGQDDVAWILFWSEMEACVAVMANSMTAFRSLFAPSRDFDPSVADPTPPSPGSKKKKTPNVQMPTMPSATFTGLRSFLRKDPFADPSDLESEPTWDGQTQNASTQAGTASFDATSTDRSRSTNRDWHETKTSHQTLVV